jgi:hypothetical protein
MGVKTWRSLALMLVMGMALGLSACGDTWSGFKEDTSENTAAVGRGMENAGEKTQDVAQ